MAEALLKNADFLNKLKFKPAYSYHENFVRKYEEHHEELLAILTKVLKPGLTDCRKYLATTGIDIDVKNFIFIFYIFSCL